MAPTPEAYHFSPTPHVPNSILPVLIYRNMLPANPTAASTRDALEKNSWLQGGVFKTYRAHHFHSVTHECYAIFKGSSRLLLGAGRSMIPTTVESRLMFLWATLSSCLFVNTLP
jgi:uncharacterized protein YjlB